MPNMSNLVNLSTTLQHSMYQVVMFLSLNETLRNFNNGLLMGDQPNYLYYFSDRTCLELIASLRTFPSGISRRENKLAVVNMLAQAEDEGRVFWMPVNRRLSDHQDTLQAVLSKIRGMGVEVPEWDPENTNHSMAYVNWEAFKSHLRQNGHRGLGFYC